MSLATLGFSAIISDLDIDNEDLAIWGKSRSRTRLSEFHEIFSGQLLHQSLQLKGEESRRDCPTWQIAFRCDVVNRGLGRLDRIIDATLLIRERRQRSRGCLRRWFCFRKQNLEIIENIVRVHNEFCALLNQPIGSNRARRTDVSRHSVN